MCSTEKTALCNWRERAHDVISTVVASENAERFFCATRVCCCGELAFIAGWCFDTHRLFPNVDSNYKLKRRRRTTYLLLRHAQKSNMETSASESQQQSTLLWLKMYECYKLRIADFLGLFGGTNEFSRRVRMSRSLSENLLWPPQTMSYRKRFILTWKVFSMFSRVHCLVCDVSTLTWGYILRRNHALFKCAFMLKWFS